MKPTSEDALKLFAAGKEAHDHAMLLREQLGIRPTATEEGTVQTILLSALATSYGNMLKEVPPEHLAKCKAFAMEAAAASLTILIDVAVRS